MRYFVLLFVCAFVVAFGAISMVQSYTPANAGIGAADDVSDDTNVVDCRDDGDDHANEDPNLGDNPDNEDNPELLGPPNPNDPGEQGDTEDEDPGYESDDHSENCRPTIAPDTATPCPSLYQPRGGASECCPPFAQGNGLFTCVCPDSIGGDVVPEGFCYCLEGAQLNGCLCEFGFFAPDCCQAYGYFCGGAMSLADADCDGSVTVMDAYETLVVLSGFEPGGGCGGGSPGDADCSSAVDAKDTLAILAVVAGLETAAAC